MTLNEAAAIHTPGCPTRIGEDCDGLCFHTLTEAAVLIGRSSTTLRHQVQRGHLTARRFGKTYVVTASELARYASQNRRDNHAAHGITADRPDWCPKCLAEAERESAS